MAKQISKKLSQEEMTINGLVDAWSEKHSDEILAIYERVSGQYLLNETAQWESNYNDVKKSCVCCLSALRHIMIDRNI